jgi:predicted amidohydrolase YtcJ
MGKDMLRSVSLASLMVGVLLAGAAMAATDEADLILAGGEIRVPGGWAQSLAVRRGVIVALGTDAEIAPFRGERTRLIDLAGATVLPGLHDMHIHPMHSGLGRVYSCSFPQGSNAATVQEAVRGCIARRGKGQWIVGGQWDVASFGRTVPHRSVLDKVSPDSPVVLADISGHSSLANSRALVLAGITRATPDPAGGIIERDARGEPTGVLRESAAGLVRGLVPAYTHEQNVEGIAYTLRLTLAEGITSFTDAGGDIESARAFAELADRGVLKQRVRSCLGWKPPVFSAAAGREGMNAITMRNQFARERLKFDCVKVMLDGVPTSGHTAAMLEPYADASVQRDAALARGISMIPQLELNRIVTNLDRQGLTVKFHAAGDAAVRSSLDAIEAARKANGFSGLLHDVGHNSFVHPSDIGRARALGATFEFSPYIWQPNPIIPDIARAIGPERMSRWIPVKDAIDAGALVVPGSDWSVVPSVSPWNAIETLVTRQQIGGVGEVLAPQERITLEQAFDLFTVNSARQMGNANRTGRIEEGLLADLIVVDRNPFRIPVTDIHKVKVLRTLINGEIVYEAP